MKNCAKRSRPPYRGAFSLGIGRLVLLLLAELPGLFAVEDAESSK
jgi:hypothetical protein